ncbi:MAG: helix-turn-helix transcriptional regulator [Haloplasmataceae bacterium]|jgi:putative transcriptional regulator|nr:helix-turn-helix transcriptional regulator [Haloplasmataceae bacterium]
MHCLWQRAPTWIFASKGGVAMFNENFKTLRKQKGMSQETLAQQLNIVRQTISKWEKGLSVPDADMLTRIAELFEVSVSELLGSKIEEEKNIN